MALDVVSSDSAPADPPAGATFFYDLAGVDCYLVAERIRGELPVVCDWVPVHAAALGLRGVTEDPDPAALAARIAAQGLLALRMPPGWPPDSELAVRVATYAKGAGKSIAFSLAAFRQAFAGGRDLADESTVLLAAAACEMHPTAVLKGAGLKSTAAALARAGDQARGAGVATLPAIRIPAGGLHQGPGALDAAVAALGHAPG